MANACNEISFSLDPFYTTHITNSITDAFTPWLGVEHTPDNERLVLLAFLSLSPLQRGGSFLNSNLMATYPSAGPAFRSLVRREGFGTDAFTPWQGVEHTPDNERLVLLAFLSLSPL